MAILGSILFAYQGAFVLEEIAAQVLLLGVLLGAVHWGRNGGFIAAIAASLIYVVVRIPLALSEQRLTGAVASLILVRVLTYGLIGIVGGELCSRIRYIFARLEDSSSIDEWSRLYNQRLIGRTLATAAGQYTRYRTAYSVVILDLSEALFADLRASKQRSLVRGIADYIRNDIRLVDEAGRLDDGRFVIVLPHTPKEGGRVVAERLHKGACDTVGAKNDSIAMTLLGADEDAASLADLTSSIAEGVDETQVSSE
jgi:GGDEF domain-containing protein